MRRTQAHEFYLILRSFWRTDGPVATFRRLLKGLYGFSHYRCRICRGYKGYNCTDRCVICIYTPLIIAMQRIPG